MPRKRHKATTVRVGTPATIFAALGDDTRLRLIARLRDTGPMSIVSLADGFDISRQAISKHLRVIHAAGLAHSGRHGRETVWELEPGGLAKARQHLTMISKDWDDKLQRLKHQVEGA